MVFSTLFLATKTKQSTVTMKWYIFTDYLNKGSNTWLNTDIIETYKDHFKRTRTKLLFI